MKKANVLIACGFPAFVVVITTGFVTFGVSNVVVTIPAPEADACTVLKTVVIGTVTVWASGVVIIVVFLTPHSVLQKSSLQHLGGQREFWKVEDSVAHA